MSIKDEITTLIQVLQDQLKNFKDVPEERLEAFLDLCLDEKDNYGDERIETREFQIVLLCQEADVRDKDNIGHCGQTMDYFWNAEEEKWESEDEREESEEEDDEEEDDLDEEE